MVQAGVFMKKRHHGVFGRCLRMNYRSKNKQRGGRDKTNGASENIRKGILYEMAVEFYMPNAD